MPERVDNSKDIFQPSIWEYGASEVQASTHMLHERIAQEGTTALSDTRLLALALGSIAIEDELSRMLSSYSLHDLLRADTFELGHFLGSGRSMQLTAIAELHRRLNTPPSEKYQIKCPADIANLVMGQMSYLDHEELRVITLDTKYYVISNQILYKGTVNSSVVRVSEIYKAAITRKCPAIAIAHSHPSGNPEPSPEDITVTECLIEAGKHLDIELVDHIIIGNQKFVSIKDRLRW